MQYISFSSGSSGNCALVRTGSAALLVDAGLSMRRTKAYLAALGLSLGDLSGILITHEHSDHVGGLQMLTKYYRLLVYASGGTARALLRSGRCPEDCLHPLAAGEALALGGLRVLGFDTPHDAAEPFGYRLEDGGGALAVLTDLGCLTRQVLMGAAGCRAAVVEANHDEAMLRCGPYPYSLKQRILGNRGHLSNETGAELAYRLAEAGAGEIILAHLSRENNTPALALAAARRRLGPEIRLSVAPREEPSHEITL